MKIVTGHVDTQSANIAFHIRIFRENALTLNRSANDMLENAESLILLFCSERAVERDNSSRISKYNPYVHSIYPQLSSNEL